MEKEGKKNTNLTPLICNNFSFKLDYTLYTIQSSARNHIWVHRLLSSIAVGEHYNFGLEILIEAQILFSLMSVFCFV